MKSSKGIDKCAYEKESKELVNKICKNIQKELGKCACKSGSKKLDIKYAKKLASNKQKSV